VGRDLGLDGVVDHFTLNSDEAGWLRNKTGATRLGFAVQLKFLLWRGRFPRMRLELPPDAIEHVAKQVGVAASELAFYGFTSRAATTALAAVRISDEGLAEVKRHLDAMREAKDDVEKLNAHDAAFHHAVIAAAGNESLLTLLEGISGRTIRARIWRGLVDAQAAGRTLVEHEAIYEALASRDASLSKAAALMHVGNTERWLELNSTGSAPR